MKIRKQTKHPLIFSDFDINTQELRLHNHKMDMNQKKWKKHKNPIEKHKVELNFPPKEKAYNFPSCSEKVGQANKQSWETTTKVKYTTQQ